MRWFSVPVEGLEAQGPEGGGFRSGVAAGEIVFVFCVHHRATAKSTQVHGV